jgi:hypothetical protein
MGASWRSKSEHGPCQWRQHTPRGALRWGTGNPHTRSSFGALARPAFCTHSNLWLCPRAASGQCSPGGVGVHPEHPSNITRVEVTLRHPCLLAQTPVCVSARCPIHRQPHRQPHIIASPTTRTTPSTRAQRRGWRRLGGLHIRAGAYRWPLQRRNYYARRYRPQRCAFGWAPLHTGN